MIRLLAAAVLALASAGAASPIATPEIAGCPIFPATNPWNQRVDKLPVAKNSATLIRAIGLDRPLHADFGSGLYDGEPIGIPYNVVPAAQPTVHVTFEYADESDKGPYPIPAHPRIEGGSDHHILIVQQGTCRLFELGGAQHTAAGWQAWAGASWSLRSNAVRPATWTSADAAGLPILPGLARYGDLDHALRFTAERTRRAFIYPARHYASDSTDPSLPPMGLRVRLKASFDVSGFPPQARAVLEALKRYGMILADNGSPWFITGAPDPRWSNDELHALGRVTGRDLEVVDTSGLRP
ncbi:MAG TPA: hypothetical protein VKR23_14815 [Gaiellaceae bacterium]|nr:hypothetical protein [Gaiellaceae bacterium]